MKRYLRIVIYGFLVWLITFVISVAMTPIKFYSGQLFDSLIPVALAIVVIVSLAFYFRNMPAGFFREGILLGVVWLVLSILLDLPLFSEGPMKMSFGDYMIDIGFTYLLIPATTIGLGYLLDMKLGVGAAAH